MDRWRRRAHERLDLICEIPEAPEMRRGIAEEYSVACRLTGLPLEQSINENAVDTIAALGTRFGGPCVFLLAAVELA